MKTTSNKTIFAWFNAILQVKAEYLLIKYRWYPLNLLYEYFKYETGNKTMTYHSFSRSVLFCSTSTTLNSSVHSRRCKKFNDTKRIREVLLLDIRNKVNLLNINDYETLDSPSLDSMTFDSHTTMFTNPLSSDDSTSQTANDWINIEESKQEEEQQKDPLHLLLEAAVSSPNADSSLPINSFNTTTTSQQPTSSQQQESISSHHQPTSSHHQPTLLHHFISIQPLLDFHLSPRINPCTQETITVASSSTPRTGTKWAILTTALELGYGVRLCLNEKKRMVDAIITYYSYIGGYASKVAEFNTFKKWFGKFEEAKRNGRLDEVFEDKRRCPRLPYIESLEYKFPGFVHECYRYATSTVGADAQLLTLLRIMEEYAKTTYPYCQIRRNLSLTRHHYRRFFRIFQGSYVSPTTKPMLNDTHIKDRFNWALKWKAWLRLPKNQRHCVFLDEKWFYITTKRRKLRKLPPHPLTETATDAHVYQPKALSRRYPVKVMFQGIISRPYPEHHFNGCIMLKRCSKTRKSKRLSYNQYFDDSYHITHLLKTNDWKNTCFIDNETLTAEVIDDIHYHYALREAISDNLLLT
jgi:hypothetical protein